MIFSLTPIFNYTLFPYAVVLIHHDLILINLRTKKTYELKKDVCHGILKCYFIEGTFGECWHMYEVDSNRVMHYIITNEAIEALKLLADEWLIIII